MLQSMGSHSRTRLRTDLTDRHTYIVMQINIVRKSVMTLFATTKVYYLFWPYHVAFRMPSRVQPVPPAVEAWRPNHWTTREFPLQSKSLEAAGRIVIRGTD